MLSKIPELPAELRDRLYEALLNCEEFDSNVRLQAVIANGELAVYSRWFLEHEYETKEERVKHTLKYLIRQKLRGIKPAFPLLLIALQATLMEGDTLHFLRAENP